MRQTDQYVALRSPRGDVARLLAAAEACRRHLQAAGVAAAAGDGRGPAGRPGRSAGARRTALLGKWPETWTQDWPDASTGEVGGVLNYAPKNARVTAPKYADADDPPPAGADVREARRPGGAPLPRGTGKALPR